MCSVVRILSLSFENLQNENDFLSHLKKSKIKNRALSGPRGLFIVPIAQKFICGNVQCCQDSVTQF